MCEIRDLGRVDMRFVCPHDVKKMFLKQARTIYWRTWEAKHECQKLKEEVWFDLVKAMLRKKFGEKWTDKHHHVLRKIVVEGGWVQKRLSDIVW